MMLKIFLILVWITNSLSILQHLSFLLRSRLRGEKQYRTTYISEYDEEGQIREMKNIELCINQASPVVVIHVSNGTVIGYCSKSDSISKIVGVDFITRLNDPKFYLICTGLGGDCRETISNLKQYILNTTYDKNIIASGRSASTFLGSMFQKATTGKTRSYACHAIICDMRKHDYDGNITGTLYDIHPSGK